MANSQSHLRSDKEMEKVKFNLGASEFSVDAGAPLPEGYGDNHLIILSRDPFWFFAYWEITHERAEQTRTAHGRDCWDRAALILRVYDLGESTQTPIDEARSFDVEVNKSARQWYVQVPESGHVYVADLGLRWPDGKYVSLFRSNLIRQPFGRASNKTDGEWMTVGLAAEEWEILARRAIGAGSSKAASGEGARGMELRWEFFRSVFSGSVSSWRPQPSLPEPKLEKQP